MCPVLAIAAYASLLPLGKWQPDEFIQFHTIAVEGWRAVAGRVLGLSPRPVSEALLWGYATIANATGAPLVMPFLALLWAGLIGAALLAARCKLPALVLVAAYLLVAKPGEMFYWPAGAAAYITGIAALTVACLSVERSAPWLEGTALVVAAWSDEIAATVVLVDAVLRIALRATPGARADRQGRTGAAWGVPLIAGAAAAGVMAVLLTHRLALRIELAPGATRSQFLPSLAVALPQFARELVAISFPGKRQLLLAGFNLKILLLLGFRPGVTAARDVRLRLLARGVALLVGGAASLVFAYHQFGDDCCERHAAFRADLIVLALYCLAQTWPTRLSATVRATLLAVPVLVMLGWHARDIRIDHSLIAPSASAEQANWASGRAPGPAMTWRNPPYPRLASGWLLDSGQYARSSDNEAGALDWRCFAVMTFFGKTMLVVPQPGSGSGN